VAGELHVGSLSGTVELEDKASSTLDRLIAKTDQLAEGMGHSAQSTLKTAEALFTAEAAWHAAEKAAHLFTETVKDLTYEGAKIADVEHNFERLAESTGRLGETLIKDLREGTHGTITDFQLMQTANRDLAAGMNLTNEQFKTLSKGAFALAQATGTDVKNAMDTMNDAMLTGRTRSLALLTGKIDLAAAEDRFARSLGKTAENLTAEGKIEAARIAILESVGKATERLGEQTDGLDEKVDQARTTWKNFEEDLGKTIATSPVILKAFDDIGAILKEAFGDDKDALIKNIAHGIESVATATVTVVRVGVDLIKFLDATKGLLIPIGTALATYVATTKAAELATVAFAASTKLMAGGLAAAATSAGTLGLAVGVFTAAYEGMSFILRQFTKKQDEANAAVQKHNEEVMNASHAQEELGHKTETTTNFIQESKQEMSKAAEEAKKLADIDKQIAAVGKDWHETLRGMNNELVRNIEHLNKNGISMSDLQFKYKLTDAQVKALTEDMQANQKAMDEQTKKAKEQADALKELAGMSADWEDVVARIPSKLVEAAEKYLKLGASIETVAKALGLTKPQVDAVKKAMDAAAASSDKLAGSLKDRTSQAALTAGHTVKTLAGEIISLDEALKRRAQGGSSEVTSANFQQSLNSYLTNGNNNPAGLGRQQYMDPYRLASQGYSFQEVIQYAYSPHTGNLPPPHGPRIPGFREGGWGDFGEGTLAMLHGKEAIVPLDKGIGAGDTYHFYVNGTGREVARVVSEELMKRQKLRRKYGSA
jgi:hypothetical protein